jgi:hypothetical protein
MLSSVEAWRAGLYAQTFDGTQGDSPLFGYYLLCLIMGYYSPSQ